MPRIAYRQRPAVPVAARSTAAPGTLTAGEQAVFQVLLEELNDLRENLGLDARRLEEMQERCTELLGGMP